MPRIRYVKPEFFDDEKIASLPVDARFLFIGLWCWADKSGVFEFAPRMIRKNVFPYDDITVSKVEELLQRLVVSRRILVAEHEGKRYGQIPSFARHQKFHIGERPKYHIPLEKFITPESHDTGTVLIPFNDAAKNIGIRNIGTDNCAAGCKGGSEKNNSDTQNEIDAKVLIDAWIGTLKHFGIERHIIPGEDMDILRRAKQYGQENVRLALVGARHEPSSSSFDPGKCLSVGRTLSKEYFDKNVNRGAQAKAEQVTVSTEESERAIDESIRKITGRGR